jgi:hypothetical protein
MSDTTRSKLVLKPNDWKSGWRNNSGIRDTQSSSGDPLGLWPVTDTQLETYLRGPHASARTAPASANRMLARLLRGSAVGLSGKRLSAVAILTDDRVMKQELGTLQTAWTRARTERGPKQC